MRMCSNVKKFTAIAHEHSDQATGGQKGLLSQLLSLVYCRCGANHLTPMLCFFVYFQVVHHAKSFREPCENDNSFQLSGLIFDISQYILTGFDNTRENSVGREYFQITASTTAKAQHPRKRAGFMS